MLSIVFVALAENALAHPFATVVSFGDSLSDTTNNPANGDYWEGRWSNGPLWDEYLAGDLGATLYDYAFAGSVTADLPGQVSAAKAAAWDETNTLFTVWSGANDFIDNAQANGTSYSSWEATAAAAVSNIKRAVSMLSEGGARYVVVLNLPDLSQLPAVETNAELAADRSLIRGFAAGFNAGLEFALSSVENQNPNLRLIFLDDFTLLDKFIANPATYGFTVVTKDALDALDDPTFDGPGADYLFWDVIHPTTKAHQLLSQYVDTALSEFPPSFVAGPSNQTAAVGQSVTFSVIALDATAYQWQLAGRKIKGATNVMYIIPSVTAAMAGLYSVEVGNSYGTATSGEARLAVEIPPSITVQPRSQNGIAGRSAVLSARATGSLPLVYQWQFNGSNILNATKATLILTNLQTNAAGAYALIANNAAGAATSHVATLSIIVPPQIVSPPTNVNALAGSSVTFSVVADGTAPLRYQWLRDGVSLARQTNSSLTISAVTPAQSGRFQVLVRNQGGSVLSAAAVLKVEKSAVATLP
ncbi:MAG: immunoglobulin domain-containing protein [Limisphaerales bacterium]